MKIEGIGVIDTPNEIEVSVADRDIKSAQRKTGSHCALAEGAKRGLGIEKAEINANMSYFLTSINGEKVWLRAKTPRGAWVEAISFDRGGKFVPGTWIFKVPTKASALGYRKEKDKGTKPRPSGKGRAKPTRTPDIRASVLYKRG
jgi:hypothetical protein